MKKKRMLAGILATLMVLVAIPVLQVSAAMPDCSVPAKGTDAEIMTRYNMAEVKKVNLAVENFENSEVFSEFTWTPGTGTAAAPTEISYSAEKGATFRKGTFAWNNGSNDWISFGENTRAISITYLPEFHSNGTSTVNFDCFLPYGTKSAEHWLFDADGNASRLTGGAGTTTKVGTISYGQTKDVFRKILFVRMGDQAVHVYIYSPAREQWEFIAGPDATDTTSSAFTGSDTRSLSYTNGITFTAGGAGFVSIKDITVYGSLPTDEEPLELHDGVGGANIGDNLETATQPANLEAALYPGLDDNARLIFAGYNQKGNLKAVVIKKKSELVNYKYTFDATSNPEIATVKVFLWDGFEKLNTLAGNKEVKISTVSQ